VLAVQFSPDGKRLASGSGDTTLRLWDLSTQLPQHECKVRGSNPASCMLETVLFQLEHAAEATAAGTPFVAVAAGCLLLIVCLLSACSLLDSSLVHLYMCTADCPEPGQQAHSTLLCTALTGVLLLHDYMCLFVQAHRNWVLVVSWSPDATMIATGDMNGDIWLWDAATGQPLGQCKGHSKWITSLVRCYI
jgi:hypothetical protein